ncbi:MAG: carbohydrate kinase family protein [Actinobacteria bacterium]|nr:carbohydrate kinase family protein [Actinomycetota bacterium]
MSALLCIGDVMLDVITVFSGEINFGEDTPAKISTHGGGAAGNVASWASQSGADVHLIARVGKDAAGATITTELEKLGVTLQVSVVEDEQTGVVVILVDSQGERTMFPDTAANSGLTFADLPPLDLYSAIYISGYALINEKSRPGVLSMIEAIKGKGLPIFFDPTTVGGMEQTTLREVRSWLPSMDVLLMNEEEAAFISGRNEISEALTFLLTLSPTVVIKRGARGAIGQSRRGLIIEVAADPAKVIDTTGAGDSFAGGFIAQWLVDPDLALCLGAGAKSAARCVGIVGARPHVTTALSG